MRRKKIAELRRSKGGMVFIYGDAGIGKTTSVIQTAPKPIGIVNLEERNQNSCFTALGLTPVDIGAKKAENEIEVFVDDYSNFSEFLDYLTDLDNFEGISSLIVDGLTTFMNVALSSEIRQQAYDSGKGKVQGKDIASQFKMNMEDYGVLAEAMFRVTKLLTRIASELDILVIVIGRQTESQNYNLKLKAAPGLKGKAFAVDMPGYFDAIGKAETRYESVEIDGNTTKQIAYPCGVRFNSKDGTFVAKKTGKMEDRYILDVQSILRDMLGATE